MPRSYEFRHVVSFEETNLVGNVYYVNHIRWQGRCRELFLRDHAPGVLALLEGELSLATTHCSCDFTDELRAFDEVAVRMRLESQVQNRLRLDFEYWKLADGRETLVARGKQELVCLRRAGDGYEPAPIPRELSDALAPYRD